MYKRILLAYDGSLEGRTALREGALLARQCDAEVFLLSVLGSRSIRDQAFCETKYESPTVASLEAPQLYLSRTCGSG